MKNSVVIGHSKHHHARELDVLYDRYAAPLYGIILRTVKTQYEAERILVNVFTLISDQINNPGNNHLHLFTWMAGIARSEALKYKSNVLHSVNKEVRSYHSWATPIFCLELTEGLSTSAIKVFQKVYLENVNLSDTSKQLEIPLCEVMVLLRKALQHINEKMKAGYSTLISIDS